MKIKLMSVGELYDLFNKIQELEKVEDSSEHYTEGNMSVEEAQEYINDIREMEILEVED
jgi:hypothetical protein